MDKSKVIFACIYLIIDILYVFISKNVYENVATNIQGTGFPQFDVTRVIAALIAYTALVVGWYVFVTKFAIELSYKMHAFVAGALAGALYGFVLYGVFNGTLHAMFKNYDVSIATRDMLWGITWASVLTGIYAYVTLKTTK